LNEATIEFLLAMAIASSTALRAKAGEQREVGTWREKYPCDCDYREIRLFIGDESI